MAQLDTSAEWQMQEAIQFAKNSPLPKPEDCLTDVYVSY
jgi:TPP-dependent pyruvate/acetoin dehydrogenase alpha subunit